MKTGFCAAVLTAVIGFAAAASAQAPPAASVAPPPLATTPPPAKEVAIDKLALTLLPAKGGAKLTVSTPAFADGADIPFENTQYRGNVFPGLTWTKGPRGTRSYAVIMQDTDGRRNEDAILHWTMFNIPSAVTKLDSAMAGPPAGAMYGPNVRGANQAYMGPRTPPGPKHRYHLQVFALDAQIPANAALTWDELKAALTGHVLASGQVIGLGSADPTAPPRPPQPPQPPAPPPT